ncbi:unnamed protein product [Peniophora sp. CBMAI 1063]|nr:unnamed protein product [Peniophora sp. CBMAI 1063]
MSCPFHLTRPSSGFALWSAQRRVVGTVESAATSTSIIAPAPPTAAAFCRRLTTPAITTTVAFDSAAIPTTTTAFEKNGAYAVDTHDDDTETMEVPQLDASWSSWASTSEPTFSPAHHTATLADITYETMQRQLERTLAIELCDGDKTYKRAPSTIDQPGPPLDMGRWQSSHGNGGAYRQVRVQESMPEYMRSPSASELPPPNWSLEPILAKQDGKCEIGLDFVPELMFAPSPSSFPSPNWGDELDWFADFPVPSLSSISSGSSTSSVTPYNGPVASPRPVKSPKLHIAEVAHLEAEAAAVVAEQEAHRQKVLAAQQWAEERYERERAQEELRRKRASRMMQALAAAGGKASIGSNESKAAWAERQEQSVWCFGSVRRRRA